MEVAFMAPRVGPRVPGAGGGASDIKCAAYEIGTNLSTTLGGIECQKGTGFLIGALLSSPYCCRR